MSHPTKRLFISVAVLLVLLAGYNVVIRFAARSSQRQHMLRVLEQIPPNTDCIFLGNSLVEAGCDLQAFEAAWPHTNPPLTPINLALGATSPVEHCLILEGALRQPLHLKYLIYGFFDDQLNVAPDGAWSDLVGNRAFSYYFPRQAAAFYDPGSWLKRWQLEMTKRIPLLAERSSLWGKVDSLRRSLEGVGMPPQKYNRFGRAGDFSALEAKDTDSFDQRCERILERHEGFSAPLRDIIRLAQEHGAKVILVEMPMPSRHRKLFYSSPAWKQARSFLEKLAGQDHAIYLSASDWVPDDRDFEDATHLNEQGAQYFSARLATAVSRISAQSTLVAQGSDGAKVEAR